MEVCRQLVGLKLRRILTGPGIKHDQSLGLKSYWLGKINFVVKESKFSNSIGAHVSLQCSEIAEYTERDEVTGGAYPVNTQQPLSHD